MSSWNYLVSRIDALPSDQLRSEYILEQQNKSLRKIGQLRGERHVILCGPAFLQKPGAPAENLLVTHEDINGLMSVTHRMEGQRGLSLILHKPGGRPDAADSIVTYLRSKFGSIEVIIPAPRREGTHSLTGRSTCPGPGRTTRAAVRRCHGGVEVSAADGTGPARQAGRLDPPAAVR